MFEPKAGRVKEEMKGGKRDFGKKKKLMGSLDHLISYCKANKLLNKLIPNGVKEKIC